MAHLQLLLSPDSPAAMLIKHGPGDFSCTIGWNREGDVFQMGQCLTRRIEYPDVSPDGQYLCYFVRDYRRHAEYSSYRAISRAPWLKALAFWPAEPGKPAPGSALFLRNNTEHPHLYIGGNRCPAKWDYLGTKTTTELPRRWQKFAESCYQQQRDGWSAISGWECVPLTPHDPEGTHGDLARNAHRIHLEKDLPHGWRLQMTRWIGNNRLPGRGLLHDTFALIPPKEKIQEMPDWHSADYDAPRGRLVWTENNTLHAAQLCPLGLESPKLLWDGRELRFQALQAPY